MKLRLPLAARGAATTPVLTLLLLGVIAMLSVLGAAAPKMLADGRTATVKRAVEAVPVLARWPSATTPGLPAFDPLTAPEVGVWGSALTSLGEMRARQPEPLRDLLGTPRLAIALDAQPTFDRDPARTEPVPDNRVALVSDPGLLRRAELVEGRLPEPTPTAGGIEIALTETVAEQLAWPVGSERLWDGAKLRLTGLVAPSGREADDWAFISGSVDPVVEVDGGGNRVLVASAFMHLDQMSKFTDRVRDIKATVWVPFESSRITADTAEAAAAQLRLLPADPAPLPMYDNTFFERGVPLLSALPQAIETGIVRAEVMRNVVTVVAVGPITVALVVLALVSRLIAARRVESTRVLRARGASTARLIAMLGGEGLALGVLGAAIGGGIAAVGPGVEGWSAFLVPAVLAAVPAVVLPWASLAEAERRGRSDLGQLGEPTGGGRARAALEVLILVVTVALAVLVAVSGDGEGVGGGGGVDPLLLALILLLGASASMLALRLLPLLLRAAERRGRRKESLAALLGPARAARDRVIRIAPVLGVVIGLGVAVFSVAFSATVAGGIERSARAGVGADVRVEASYINDGAFARVSSLDGVAAIAALRGDSSVDATAGGSKARARAYVVDREKFVAVQRNSASQLALPEPLAEPASGAVPVVASERLLAELGLGDEAGAVGGVEPAVGGEEFTVNGSPVRVVAAAPSQLPFGTAEQWVIIDAVNARALGLRAGGISQLYLSIAPGADADAVGTAAAAAIGGSAAYETPAQAASEYAEDPAYRVVQGALLAASALVALLLALATVASLLLGAESRASMLAVLRALGHSRRRTGSLVAWEVVPAILVALPFGVGAGIAMAMLLIPQLDLRGFVGGHAQPELALGGVWLPIVVLGFSAAVALAVWVAAALGSRIGVVGERVREDG